MVVLSLLQYAVVYLSLTNNGRITSSHVNDSRWISNSSTTINNEIKALEFKTLQHVMLSIQAIYFPPTLVLRMTCSRAIHKSN
jgi:hypothetical protein